MDETQVISSLVLFVLMAVVGLELTPDDFRRVAAAPRAVIVGTLAQLLLLPLMTWLVVVGVGVSPVFGAGAVLVAVSPGAGASNLLAALARANIALSVTLTAFSSVLAVVSLPVVSSVGMRVFLGDAAVVDVPVGPLIGQLALTLLLPIGLGMWLRQRRPDIAIAYGPRLQRIAFIVIATLIAVGIAVGEDPEMAVAGFRRALVAAGLWTVTAMAIGYAVASLLRLSAADRFTFLIEFSTRNIAIATIVAISGLASIELTFFSGAYIAVGYPIAVVAVLLRRRLARPES